ncbi:MAG: tRNA (N6-threonylcarbamoyladenosine(37)-N6)-methyltransferase TrmO [Chloroflexota bacterium]
MKSITFHPIGIIHSPYKSLIDMPIQPSGAKGAVGQIELLPEYVPGLLDLDGFSHLILFYHFHLAKGYELETVPFLDNQPHGVFATRAPKRPNAIGTSTVRLDSIEGAILQISEVDIVDGTPLLDIKPYVPAFDDRANAKIGWLTGKAMQAVQQRADHRFDN